MAVENDFKKKIFVHYLEDLLKNAPLGEPIYKTSEQIQDELSPMMEIDINTIAELMNSMGYELRRAPDNQLSWVMV